MTGPGTRPDVGTLLRDWRRRRRWSQLELSCEAGVSSRHLSFLETGRAHPSRAMVLRLAEHLDVPLRERNQLLVAAGFAPAYPERGLQDPQMSPVREALDLVLTGYEPHPPSSSTAGGTSWRATAAPTRSSRGSCRSCSSRR
jgi:transcriptional regulator with XRE-family HTH domain